MAEKLLHLVIKECGDCPYMEEVKPGDARCAAPNRFQRVNPKEIPADCPLPNHVIRTG